LAGPDTARERCTRRKPGFPYESSRRPKKVRQVQADSGPRPDLPSTAERQEIRKLRAENFELRRANEMLKSASAFFAKELDEDRTR